MVLSQRLQPEGGSLHSEARCKLRIGIHGLMWLVKLEDGQSLGTHHLQIRIIQDPLSLQPFVVLGTWCVEYGCHISSLASLGADVSTCTCLSAL